MNGFTVFGGRAHSPFAADVNHGEQARHTSCLGQKPITEESVGMSVLKKATTNTFISQTGEIAFQAFQSADFGFIVVDDEGVVRLWNNWIEETTAIPAEQAVGRDLQSLFPGLHGLGLMQAIRSVCAGKATQKTALPCDRVLPLKGGENVRHEVAIKGLTGPDGSIHCLIQIFNPYSDQQKAVDTCVGPYPSKASNDDLGILRRERERARAVLDSVSDGVITVDGENRVETMNMTAEQLTGWKLDDARGRPLDEVFQLGNLDAVEGPAEGMESRSELVLVSAQGTEFPIELSVTAIDGPEAGDWGSVIVFRDLTSSRKMAAELMWRASHDHLTGLENRTGFEQRLKRLLAGAINNGEEHALLYLDLDQFKIVNDTCGHYAGDKLLERLSNLLKHKVRDSDTIARLGGDEFGILLKGCSLEPALGLANELRTLVNEFRFKWEDKIFAVGLSIGLVIINRESKDAASVLMAADAACYAAKEGGRNRVHVFEVETSVAAQRKSEMQWVSRIHMALEYGGLELYCQDIISVQDRVSTPSHVEILVRLHEDMRDLILPGAFIPAAERYNMMPQIDHWVVQKALGYLAGQLRRGAEAGDKIPSMNINLSGASLVEEGFLSFILNTLETSGVPPAMICFEITETAAIANLDEAVDFINTLKGIGCRFALDDFGSGLSSFGYLKHLPVDYLKIDGAFIKDLSGNLIHRAMVDAINRLGHVMGIQTVAEFVGDEETLEILREIGVDYAQGYYIGKPYVLDSSAIDGERQIAQG